MTSHPVSGDRPNDYPPACPAYAAQSGRAGRVRGRSTPRPRPRGCGATLSRAHPNCEIAPCGPAQSAPLHRTDRPGRRPLQPASIKIRTSRGEGRAPPEVNCNDRIRLQRFRRCWWQALGAGGLDGGDGDHVGDVGSGTAAGQIIGGAGQALQNRAQSGGSGEALD